jgi:hypothetical protein
MKSIYSITLVGLIFGGLAIGAFNYYKTMCYQRMFQLHTYDWNTGMPGLEDQVTTFEQAEKRWPTNYDDLVGFMKQSITNFVPTSYDRIDFETKPDGNLEIVVYVFKSEFTNHINVKPSPKI